MRATFSWPEGTTAVVSHRHTNATPDALTPDFSMTYSLHACSRGPNTEVRLQRLSPIPAETPLTLVVAPDGTFVGVRGLGEGDTMLSLDMTTNAPSTTPQLHHLLNIAELWLCAVEIWVDAPLVVGPITQPGPLGFKRHVSRVQNSAVDAEATLADHLNDETRAAASSLVGGSMDGCKGTRQVDVAVQFSPNGLLPTKLVHRRVVNYTAPFEFNMDTTTEIDVKYGPPRPCE